MTIFQYPKCAHGHDYGMCHICEGAGEMRKGDGNFVEKMGGEISPHVERFPIDDNGVVRGVISEARQMREEIERLKSELQEAKDVIQGLEEENYWLHKRELSP